MSKPRTKPRRPTTAHLRELRAIRQAIDDVRAIMESGGPGPIKRAVARSKRI